jgi:hypothetical protein
MGGQGVGALAWGAFASWIPLPITLSIAAGLLLIGALTLIWWPLMPQTGQLDRTPTPIEPPKLALTPDPDDGPLRVAVVYRIDPADVPGFVAQARRVELSRRRTGAYRWALWRDLSNVSPATFVEEFELDSWREYTDDLSERVTGFDSQLAVDLGAMSREHPVVSWYLPAGLQGSGTGWQASSNAT